MVIRTCLCLFEKNRGGYLNIKLAESIQNKRKQEK